MHGAHLRRGQVRAMRVTPEDAGLPRAKLSDLTGGDAAHNAAALRDVLAGKASAYRDIVLLNTAAAMIVADRATTLTEGVALAAEAISSRRAQRALDALVEITHQGAA